MAMKVESEYNCPNESFRFKDDLGDLQITESTSDRDYLCEHNNTNSKMLQVRSTLSSFRPCLVKPSVMPGFGNVAVTNSENVQFGNNIYFNGPVTFEKNILDNSAVNNLSTEDTGNDIAGTASVTPTEKCQILVRYKVILSVIAVLVIVGMSMVFLLKNKVYDQSTSPVLESDTPGTSDSGELLIVSRNDWAAQPVEGELTELVQPIPWVIISDTMSESCKTQSQCVLSVSLIQKIHIESRGMSDIGYNFLVGGDGSVYYGRGWDYEGAHTKYYNKYSIGIAFIGTFNNDPPSKQQVEACQKLINLGVSLGKLYKDYHLLAHRQLMSTLSPGDKVYDIIKEWPHFVSNYTNIKDLLPPDRRLSLG